MDEAEKTNVPSSTECGVEGHIGRKKPVFTYQMIQAKRRITSNVYRVNGTALLGGKKVYEYLRKHGYDLSLSQVKKLIFINEFSRENCKRYPELDPYNENKIWKLESRGSISKALCEKDRTPKHRYALIYYLTDEKNNRYYGYTYSSVAKEMSVIKHYVELGRFSSTDFSQYHIYPLEIVHFTTGTASRLMMGKKIAKYSDKFIENNPDKKVVYLYELTRREYVI